ncbi:MAG: SprT-like domain-containing protein [Terriglobales bacterium]
MAKQGNFAHIYRLGKDRFRLTFISKTPSGATFASELRDGAGWDLQGYLKDHMHPSTDFEAVIGSIGKQTELQLTSGVAIRGHYEDDSIVESPATVEDLCQWMSDFQQKYFEDREITISVAITQKNELGGTACFGAATENGGIVSVPEELLPFGKCLKIVLLHEMIHANLHVTGKTDPGNGHGELFKAEVKRLMNAGAYDSLL